MSPEIRKFTTGIVSAYVVQNSIAARDLPDLMRSVAGALAALGQPPVEPEAARPTPPVSIKASVTREYLVSLEDGQRYKSLKRHLAGRGMTPADYRAKWGLAADYPMVAAAYSERRSALAKSFGLGKPRPTA